jgi:hypothetical protein
MTPDPDEFSGYRFKDLKRANIVSSRTDLNRKQREHGFPKPIKLGDRQAWFPKSEVHCLVETAGRAARKAWHQGGATGCEPP